MLIAISTTKDENIISHKEEIIPFTCSCSDLLEFETIDYCIKILVDFVKRCRSRGEKNRVEYAILCERYLPDTKIRSILPHVPDAFISIQTGHRKRVPGYRATYHQCNCKIIMVSFQGETGYRFFKDL